MPSWQTRVILSIILSAASRLSEKDFLDYLKTLGTYTLAHITSTGKNLELRFVLELQNLTGYDSILHRTYSVSEDVKPFITPVEPYIIPDKFAYYIRKVIDNLNILSLDHLFLFFIAFRDNWNIDGASTVGTPLQISFVSKFANKIRTYIRKFNTKFFSLLEYKDEELVNKALTIWQAVCKPFLKLDEAGKGRTVIGYDTWAYLRGSYLETFIDTKGKEFWSTLKASPMRKLLARRHICNAIKEHKNILCVDQSSFDQHQPKEIIIYALQYLFQRIEKVNPQTKDVIDAELKSLQNVFLYADDSYSKLKPWTKGLLSGYKFTALLGSLLNKAEFLYVCDLCHYHPENGFFQGDDAIAWFSHPISKNKIAEAYKSLGFEVNALKTWYGTECTEFLREIYTADRVYGMPSRCGLSLIFDKPKPHKIQPDQRWVKNNSNLLKAKRRGLNVDPIIKSYNYRYLSSHLLPTYNISQKKFTQYLSYYLSTPSALGGLGLMPYIPGNPVVSVHRHISESNKSDFSFVTPITYHPIPDFETYLRKKLKDRIRLGNTATFYTFNITKSPNMNNDEIFRLPTSHVSLPPFDWNYPGNDKSSEYYINRLSFSIHQQPLPTDNYSKGNYMMAKKFINQQYSFDDFMSTQETHIHLSIYIEKAQRFLCHRLLNGKHSFSFILKKIRNNIISYYNFLYSNSLYNFNSINKYILYGRKRSLYCKCFGSSTPIIISV